MNKEKQKLVPELRFPEFENDGTWKKESLGEIGKPLMCKRIFKEQTSDNSENAIPFYKIGTFGGKADAYIPVDLYYDYKSKYSFPNIGDILISASGTIGRLVVYDGADAYFQDSNIVWIGNNENKITNSLLFYFYSTLVWQTSDGGVIKRLYNSNLKEMEIHFPKNPKEQQKIANCLSSLDNLITAETEKLDHLKDHKKGLLQQLFPANGESKPKFRFPEFEKDGDWEETTLGEVCTFSKGKDLPKSVIVKNGTSPCVHYGQLFTEYSEVIRMIKSFTDMKSSVLSKKNDVLMPTSDVTPKGLAKASCIKIENVVLGGDILIIRPDEQKIFGEFLSRYIRYLEREVLKFVSGSTVFHLYASSMKLLELYLPTIKEQQKIADCFSSADDLIATQEQKIENLKVHKKGLMQQLFPNTNDLVA